MFFSIETVFKEVGAEAKVKFLRICTIEALQMSEEVMKSYVMRSCFAKCFFYRNCF
jgi:ribosomal protein L20A (L18A)